MPPKETIGRTQKQDHRDGGAMVVASSSFTSAVEMASMGTKRFLFCGRRKGLPYRFPHGPKTHKCG